MGTIQAASFTRHCRGIGLPSYGGMQFAFWLPEMPHPFQVPTFPLQFLRSGQMTIWWSYVTGRGRYIERRTTLVE